MRILRPIRLLVIAALAAAVVGAAQPTYGESADVDIALDVPTMVSVNVDGCSEPDSTLLPHMLPGDAAVTADCVIEFGGNGEVRLAGINVSRGGNAMMAIWDGPLEAWLPFNGQLWEVMYQTEIDALHEPDWVEGPPGRGSALAGTMALADLDEPVDASFTVQTWFRRPASPPTMSMPVIQTGNDFDDTRAIVMVDDGEMVAITSFDGVPVEVRVNAADVLDDAWHQLTYQYDEGAQELRLYLDGELAGSTSASGAIGPTGGFMGVGWPDRIGAVDEARFFLYALDDATIRHSMHHGVDDYDPTPGPDRRTWDSGPDTSMFGVCLRTLSNGATSTLGSWTSDGVGGGGANCAMTDADPWRALPPEPDSPIAVAPQGSPNARVHLRFGARLGSDVDPGAYLGFLYLIAYDPTVVDAGGGVPV